MRRTLVLIAGTALAVGALTGPGSAAPAGAIKICGQKQGPATSWSDTVPGVGKFKFKGSTWTVFATDVSCSVALKATPGHLARWSKAKIGGHWRAGGWYCGKEKGKGYTGSGVSSGSIGCVGPNTQFIAIKMYAPYTLAQIKQVAATGKLPG